MEPKIKTPFKGVINIENIHEDVIVSIKDKKQEVKYILRKYDLAKPNELAGVSGSIDGKLYLPYQSGMQVEENESIVEVIKEGWNVPNRIPLRVKFSRRWRACSSKYQSRRKRNTQILHP